MRKERQMTQKEIDEAWEKMYKAYESKGVDFDTRCFVLDVNPPQVRFIKSVAGDFNDEIFINFTKEVPVKHRDFKLEDYPKEVQDILKQQYNADDMDDDYFPNFIVTASGEDLLDAIEKMTRMSILLDHGWDLFCDDDDYQEEHGYFFGSDDEDDEEEEDWDDEDEDEDEDEEDDDEDDDDEK